MSDLRDEIAFALIDYAVGQRRTPDLGERADHTDATARDLLATIREALLSDGALLAFSAGVAAYAWSPENSDQVIAKGVEMTRAGMVAALDAAGIGGQGDDDE